MTNGSLNLAKLRECLGAADQLLTSIPVNKDPTARRLVDRAKSLSDKRRHYLDVEMIILLGAAIGKPDNSWTDPSQMDRVFEDIAFVSGHWFITNNVVPCRKAIRDQISLMSDNAARENQEGILESLAHALVEAVGTAIPGSDAYRLAVAVVLLRILYLLSFADAALIGDGLWTMPDEELKNKVWHIQQELRNRPPTWSEIKQVHDDLARRAERGELLL